MVLPSKHEDIENISRVTCRIEGPKNKGTGILIKFNKDDNIYIFTAKHCILGKDFDQDIEKISIKLHIPLIDGKFEVLTLNDNDKILFSNKEDIDCAVIALDTSCHSEHLKNIPCINLLKLKYTSHNCILRGYPQSHGNLEGININNVSYVDNNVLTTLTLLSTLDSDPIYNCQGFSGGGVFCEFNNQYFLIGILYELEETFQRFKVYDLSYFEKILLENGKTVLEYEQPPINLAILRDIEIIKRKSNLVLNGINDTFGVDFKVHREISHYDFKSKIEDNQLLILTGEAGNGKSSFAKNVINELEKKGYVPIAFKAESFIKDSIEELIPNLQNELEDVLLHIGITNQIVILIDSLEKILEIQNQDAFNELMQICKKYNFIKVIATCRTYAYQQLTFHFHYNLPNYQSVEIPFLNEKELLEVKKQYPFLEEVLMNHGFKDILKRPFYLNQLILNSRMLSGRKNLTENEYRKILWDEVIVKRNPERGKTFESIALKRANTMKIYVQLEWANENIISELHHDNIITLEERLGESYCPAHDIFEDIALIRFIERVYQQGMKGEEFFNSIGSKEPSIRRAFRIWLDNVLSEVDNSLNEFIIEHLEDQKVEQYWKDEIIIAILKSKFCIKFFHENEYIIQKDNYKLLLRFIHLLIVACQKPDEELIQQVSSKDNDNLYKTVYLKPNGPGWQVVIEFINQHLENLNEYKHVIIKLLVNHWAKRITPHNKVLSESKIVGRILFRYIEEGKEDYNSRRNKLFSKQEMDEAIQVLLQLSAFLEPEISSLVNKAREFNKEPSQNYNLKYFYRAVIDSVLSGIYSSEICRVLPELVGEVAIEEWLDKNSNLRRHDAFSLRGNDFGMKENRGDFPGGIFKTPIRFLLYHHPFYALKLIVSIINHATEYYANSQAGRENEIIEIELDLHNGEKTIQIGNELLWTLYRGSLGNHPHILQSILMSLENWLFELCEIKDGWASELIDRAFKYLLRESKSVAITAVLTSISIAYPNKIGRSIFPALKIKHFYRWDLIRCTYERHALAPLDHHLPFAQEQRWKSNKLPHRQKNLERLITTFQVSGYWNDVNIILDGFLENLEKEDTNWKIALQRMDIRNYEVDLKEQSQDNNSILVKPRISKDLIQVVEKADKEVKQMNTAARVTVWASEIYESKPGIEISVERWIQEYNNYLLIKDIKEMEIFVNPTYLAAVGIKFMNKEITTEHLNWCKEYILNILEQRIIARRNTNNFFPLYFKVAMEVAPLILNLDINEKERIRVKRAIFLSLLYSLDYSNNEVPYEFYREDFWNIDFDFASSCFMGIIEYAKLQKSFQSSQYIYNKKKREKALKQLFLQEDQITQSVCNNALDKEMIKNIDFDNFSSRFLLKASLILSYNTDETLFEEYPINIYNLYFKYINDNDMNDTDYVSESFELRNYIAEFLLHQPSTQGQKYFAVILESIFQLEGKHLNRDTIELIEGILEDLIVCADSLELDSFWGLWEILECKIRNADEKYFINYLFLSMPWWKADAISWNPMSRRKHYIKKLILELGEYDIESVVRLLSGIGTDILLPEGIIWLNKALGNVKDIENTLTKNITFKYCEKLCQRIYYRNLKEIKQNPEIQKSLLYLLHHLINLGSSIAFIIRERVISER